MNEIKMVFLELIFFSGYRCGRSLGDAGLA